jgi:hypothetical protein
MCKALKFFGFILFSLFLFSSCDEFPKFEGTYTGVFTITYQTYNYDLETSATVEIKRNFKEITSSYTAVLGTFSLGGKIDNLGNFAIASSGINNLGASYTITDEGQIDIGTGIYISSLTVIEDGVTTITGTFSLQKQ